MKTVVALFMGFCSGFLIYMMAALLFSSASSRPSSAFVAITFLGGWAISSWLLLNGALSVSRVLSRGFLLGAAEWFCMIGVGIIFAGKTVANAVPTSEAASAGTALGGGLVAMLTGGVSLVMAIVCLIGFAISYFMGKEMGKEVASQEPTKRCPSCAEFVHAQAVKCRHCGEVFSSVA